MAKGKRKTRQSEMRYIFAVYFVVGLLFSANAAEIAGPSRSDAGRLVVLRIVDIGEDGLAKWAVFPDKYYADWAEFDGGRTVVFASPDPGLVTFIAAVYSQGNLEILTHVVDNGGAEPEPGPGPGPGPEPVPPVPPNNPFYSVVRQIDSLTGLSGEALRSDVIKMADAIDAVLNDKKAVALQPASFRARVREAVNRALGDSVKNWYSFSTEVSKIFEKENPVTTEEHRVLYAKLVEAMRARIADGEKQ